MTLHLHNNSAFAFATCAPTNPKRKWCYCSWAKVHRLKCDQCFTRQHTIWVQQKPTNRSQTQSHMNTCTKHIFLSVYDFWNVFKITTRATRATRIHPQYGHLLKLQKLAMRQHLHVLCSVRTHIENQHVDSGYSATDWEPQNVETDVSYV